MTESTRKTISFLILLACLGFLARYVANHLADFRVILQISTAYTAIIAVLFLVFVAMNGLMLKVLITDFGVDLGFLEYLSISIVTTFGNVFLPFRGGAGFKAVYLKAKHDFDYSSFIASHAGCYLVIFNTNAVFALVGTAFLYLEKSYINVPVAIIFAGTLILTTYALLFAPKAVNWVPVRSVRETANRILAGWSVIRSSRRNMLKLFWLSFLNSFLISLITYFEFVAFGMKDLAGNPIGFVQSVVFTSVATLSLLVALTPSALGIKEGLLMFCSESLGITPAQALAVSVLDRAVGFVVLVLVFNLASIYLKKELRAKVGESVS
jgi:uncharacterized protein (TIRG00374 family)